MFRFFNHIKKEYIFSKAFQEASSLAKFGKEEEALNKFTALLPEHSANPYLRRQILILSEHLHKPVNLPQLSVRPGRKS